MIWELLGMVFTGFMAAGIVMGIRIFFKKLPTWGVVASAGIGMLFFQVYTEYTWFSHQESLLPKGTVVVAKVPETAFYKPWTAIQPQTLKFVAADISNAQANTQNPNLKKVDVYFFERRMSAQSLPMVVDCNTKKQAIWTAQVSTDAPASNSNIWHTTSYTHDLSMLLCPK